MDCAERERHFGVILEELNDCSGAVRVLQKEMCELKERLKNAQEDKAEVIQLIPRHRTTECTGTSRGRAPKAHEDKVEVTGWTCLFR